MYYNIYIRNTERERERRDDKERDGKRNRKSET
jgi:hypothetical protein